MSRTSQTAIAQPRSLLYPTGPFTILEPQHREIVEFYVVQKRRVADIEALKVRKSWSGTAGVSMNTRIEQEEKRLPRFSSRN